MSENSRNKLEISQYNKQAYDRWSKRYDHDANSTIVVDDRHFPQAWSHLSGVKILEIGCGTGRHTKRLAQNGNLVTALELSSGMLEMARTKVASSTVTFIEADFLTYEGLAPGSFDVALTSLVLEHILDIESFFKRTAHVLKPGGEFYISEIHPDRIAKGTQAHFIDPSTGQDVKLMSYAHTDAAIREVASKAGLKLELSQTILGDAGIAKLHEGWDKYLGRPMIQIWKFVKMTNK